MLQHLRLPQRDLPTCITTTSGGSENGAGTGRPVSLL
jgi:hypothetical protein